MMASPGMEPTWDNVRDPIFLIGAAVIAALTVILGTGMVAL